MAVEDFRVTVTEYSIEDYAAPIMTTQSSTRPWVLQQVVASGLKKNASKNCFLTGKNLEQVQAQGPQGGTGGKKGAGKG